jgi:hypothetical protein
MTTIECARCWQDCSEDDCTYIVTERQTRDSPEDGVMICSRCLSDITETKIERALDAASDRDYPKPWRYP